MKKFQALMIIAVALAFGQGALAFGSIDGPVAGGPVQHREHEMITRRALACFGVDNPLPAGECFNPKALDLLAGRQGTAGGVGWTDVIYFDYPDFHCDNGDYLDLPGKTYPRSQSDAAAALLECRKLMIINVEEAIQNARGLVRNGKPNYGEIPRIFCNFNGISGDAECNVLEDFGATLHAMQDFYSHSNWTDVKFGDPISLESPPPLGNTQLADWLDLSRNVPLPDGLMTGCYSGLSQGRRGCAGRVMHYNLNKDVGLIPLQGRVTPSNLGIGYRGGQLENFERAVAAAQDETRRQWAYFRDRLITTYDVADGHLMICILEAGYQPNVKELCDSRKSGRSAMKP